MKKNAIHNALSLALGATCAAAASAQPAPDRTVLPIAEPKRPVYTEIDARNAKAPARADVTAPKGAPNVVIILIDDIGFGSTSTFGGPIKTPAFDRLANNGLRYNNFHTTAVSSPTRAALKSGRNHHTMNMAFITEMATGYPGADRPGPRRSRAAGRDAAPQRLHSTAAFGKWHETASWEISVSGPFDRWPTRQGFDKFYGFFGGETNQWAPLIYRRHHPSRTAERPELPLHDRHDRQDAGMGQAPRRRCRLTSRPSSTSPPARRTRRTTCPRPGSTSGRASLTRAGTSCARRRWRARSRPGSCLRARSSPAKPPAIKDWDKLSADEKRLFAPQAEVFAAFTPYTDYETGRMLQGLRGSRAGRQRAGLLHRRRQRHQRRGRRERHV